MYAICNGAIEKETELHHLLDDYRINNEWFNFEKCEYQIIKYFDKQMYRMFFYDYAFYSPDVKLIW